MSESQSGSSDHFWYSEGQRVQGDTPMFRYGEDMSRPEPMRFCVVDGQEIEYTVMSRDKRNPSPLWEDIRYLGEGRISRIVRR